MFSAIITENDGSDKQFDSESLIAQNAILGNKEVRAAFDEKGVSLEAARELTGELHSAFIDAVTITNYCVTLLRRQLS